MRWNRNMVRCAAPVGLVALLLTACGGTEGPEPASAEDVAGISSQLRELDERLTAVERAGASTEAVTDVEPARDDASTEEPADAEPPEDEEGVHWAYEGENGPEAWGELDPSFAACADGTEQSPIDLDAAAARAVGLDDVMMDWAPSSIEVLDNGHTVQANVAPGNTTVIDGVDYELVQFHFHKPSEHTSAGAVAPMEVHFVHADAEGRLAVIGVMLEIGGANRLLGTVLNAGATAGGDPVAVEGRADLERLLPESRTRYAYAGSLTTPPCTEGVNWNVLAEPVEVSQAQVDSFPHTNARPIQPAGDREVLLDAS